MSGLQVVTAPESLYTTRRLRVAIIASLYPSRMTAKRAGFSPQPTYEIAQPSDLFTPALCVVQQQTERPYMGYERALPRKWEAEDVAADLVQEWSSGLPGSGADEAGARPAVWVSEGAKPGGNGDWIIPQEEIEHFRRRQDAILRNLIHQARWFHSQKQESSILPVMRIAAEWLNIEGEEWQRRLTSDATFKCRFCKGTLEAGAVVCIHCKEIVDRKGYDALKSVEHATEMAFEGDKTPYDGSNPIADGDPFEEAERNRLANEMGLPPDEVPLKGKRK